MRVRVCADKERGVGELIRSMSARFLFLMTAVTLGLVLAGWRPVLALVHLDGIRTAPGAKPGTGVPAPAFLTNNSLRHLPPPLRETEQILYTGNVHEITLMLERGTTELVKGVVTDAITINGQVPGPAIRVTEGDTVRLTVQNRLDEPTSIHWHGLHLPYTMDGVAPTTMLPIEPGADFAFEFTASHAGTFMYHAHGLRNEIEQVDRGLYGAFIIDPQAEHAEPPYDLDKTLILGGWTVMPPAQEPAADAPQPAEPMAMQMAYNYWTINGKSFPDIEPLRVREGDRVRLRLINISNLVHPMHMHGTDFRVIAEDGHPLQQPRIVNTIAVDAGKIYDIEFIADNPGVWVFHCHELHHTTNNDVAPGGLIQLIQYEGFEPIGLDADPGAPGNPGSDPMKGMGH